MNMPKSVWWLVIGMAINITGASFLWPLNTIYMKEELGKSLSTAGVVLMVNSLGMVVGNLLGGTLFDKIGGFFTIMLGTSLSLMSTILLNLFHGWPWYAIWLIILGFGGGMIVPAIFALAAASWPRGGRTTFNAIYLAQNIGVALGAALGGIVAELSFNYIFMANLLMYVTFFFIALFKFRIKYNATVKQNETFEGMTHVQNKKRFNALITLCVMFVLCWICYVQWQTTIASFTQSLNISMSQYSLLWTINGGLILLGQPIIAPVVSRLKHRLKLQMTIGIFIFILSFIVTSFAQQFSIFVVGMVIMTFAEMFVWPAVPTIANYLAPKGREGVYQGITNSASTIGKAFGPLIGGVLVDAFNMQIMFFSMIGLLLISFIFIQIFDRKLSPSDFKSS
ncbi:MDR family MFS transporter [Staphylococcus massiliensis]|uniref:Multidrug resistance transporter protein n=1 Tax=Staphylococcus massiliensis S46 TaxID=1229783 RepID=K9B623_9STAP|nr:MFS transporter [Staphylococcus massiliensis]EKU50272.1 multidrug resistance transporter protein [Staphylococcus massiliensis S46]MCG3399702.1 MFS transporter [Staphylococcus massiliensis]MCG3400807.1 MFS transporter [Staphylococcus massiliensis]MCG3412029.1 MFS transporter [Staphylococcus massiliensis]PNZ99948.1 MFS transporter [Staphylococcus massiliensis CCUG 55927]